MFLGPLLAVVLPEEEDVAPGVSEASSSSICGTGACRGIIRGSGRGPPVLLSSGPRARSSPIGRLGTLPDRDCRSDRVSRS